MSRLKVAPEIWRVSPVEWAQWAGYSRRTVPSNHLFPWLSCASQRRPWVLTPLRSPIRVLSATPGFRVCCLMPEDQDLQRVPPWLTAEFEAANRSWDFYLSDLELPGVAEHIAHHLQPMDEAMREETDKAQTIARAVLARRVAASTLREMELP